MKNNINKKIATTAMFASLAYLSTFIFHFINLSLPSLPFLSYDPKNIIICIAGFILGPFATIFISIIIAFIEMITISTTGFYGLIMNIVAILAFSLPSAIIYQKVRSFKGAIFSLITSFITTILVMMIWNIIITPLFLHMDRKEFIQTYLLLIILFNALQSGINVALVLMLYKPIVSSLRAIHLVDMSNKNTNKKTTILMVVLGIILLFSLILVWILIK